MAIVSKASKAKTKYIEDNYTQPSTPKSLKKNGKFTDQGIKHFKLHNSNTLNINNMLVTYPI